MKCPECGQEIIPEINLKSIDDVKEILDRKLTKFCNSRDNTQCTEAEFTKKIRDYLIEMGHENNFYVHPEYYYNDNGDEKYIDFAFFERNADILTGTPTIVIEHEQQLDISHEVKKLIKKDARYKVVIGWQDNGYNNKDTMFKGAKELIKDSRDNGYNKWCIAIGQSEKSEGGGYEPVKPGTFTYWP